MTITELTDLYHTLISKDHHKDKDCHFYINKVWSYGDPPKYQVEHYGYLYDGYESKKFDTYKEAYKELHSVVTKAIAQQCDYIYRSATEEDWRDEYLTDYYNNNKELIDTWRTK